ncbi:DUF4192 family protein [Phytomonospora endophytica]|uniref:DUF4192 family protein n=1 Tax=Phytomonospora endophytica TaxID=714109 RepID=UPI0016119A9A
MDDRLPDPAETAVPLLALADHRFAVEATAPVAPAELTARIPLLTHLLRHATGPHRAIPAALLADHVLRTGNTGLARLSLDHAKHAAPNDPLIAVVARRLASTGSTS